MKIYWHSTVPWSPSSYSILTARTVPNIVRKGHKVTLGTWYGLDGGVLPWPIKARDNGATVDTVQVLPKITGDTYGANTMQLNYEYCKADLMISCSDIWVFEHHHTYKTNFAPWFPVDYEPLPASIIDAMEPAIYPMVFSKWGQRVIEDAGLKAEYVPASVPSSVYKPGDKNKARGMFSVKTEYDFLVTMVNANKDASDRKGFAEGLAGFAKFAENHPKSKLYCHTNFNGPINIMEMAESLGIRDRVIMPDQYGYNMGFLNEDYMVSVYQASDVLLNTCKSEGFGLPMVEAQMCGCPIIAPDFSTTDELMFAGWKIKGQRDWAFGANSWRYRVFIDDVADALEEAYKDRDNEKLRYDAVHGSRRYDNDVVFEQYWKPALVEMERLVNAVTMPVIKPEAIAA